ncbi:MAG: lysophospholipid acyltransferase family protein [Armatimonadota bacterium]
MTGLQSKSRNGWRRCRSFIGNVGLFSLARIAHRLPLSVACAVGHALAALGPLVSGRHYRRVRDDIQRFLGDGATPREARQLTQRYYRHLGESLMEFLRLPYMTDDEVRHWVRVDGMEHLDAAIAEGHGVIMLTGHLGNWELCGTMMGLSPYPTTAIAREQRETGITTLYNRIREAHGLKVVSMTDVRACIRVLKRNECLGVVGDVNARVPGAFIQFLGRPAATYTGTAYLALTTGATILPIFDERLPDHTHCCRIGPPIPVSRTGDRARDVLITTLRTQYVIQQEIRRRPAEWFWQLQRWKTRPEDVPNPERIPMEHRDLTSEEVAEALRPLTDVQNQAERR